MKTRLQSTLFLVNVALVALAILAAFVLPKPAGAAGNSYDNTLWSSMSSFEDWCFSNGGRYSVVIEGAVADCDFDNGYITCDFANGTCSEVWFTGGVDPDDIDGNGIPDSNEGLQPWDPNAPRGGLEAPGTQDTIKGDRGSGGKRAPIEFEPIEVLAPAK